MEVKGLKINRALQNWGPLQIETQPIYLAWFKHRCFNKIKGLSINNSLEPNWRTPFCFSIQLTLA